MATFAPQLTTQVDAPRTITKTQIPSGGIGDNSGAILAQGLQNIGQLGIQAFKLIEQKKNEAVVNETVTGILQADEQFTLGVADTASINKTEQAFKSGGIGEVQRYTLHTRKMNDLISRNPDQAALIVDAYQKVLGGAPTKLAADARIRAVSAAKAAEDARWKPYEEAAIANNRVSPGATPVEIRAAGIQYDKEISEFAGGLSFLNETEIVAGKLSVEQVKALSVIQKGASNLMVTDEFRKASQLFNSADPKEQAQARISLDRIRNNLQFTKQRLRAQYPGIPAETIDKAFKGAEDLSSFLDTKGFKTSDDIVDTFNKALINITRTDLLSNKDYQKMAAIKQDAGPQAAALFYEKGLNLVSDQDKAADKVSLFSEVIKGVTTPTVNKLTGQVQTSNANEATVGYQSLTDMLTSKFDLSDEKSQKTMTNLSLAITGNNDIIRNVKNRRDFLKRMDNLVVSNNLQSTMQDKSNSQGVALKVIDAALKQGSANIKEIESLADIGNLFVLEQNNGKFSLKLLPAAEDADGPFTDTNNIGSFKRAQVLVTELNKTIEVTSMYSWAMQKDPSLTKKQAAALVSTVGSLTEDQSVEIEPFTITDLGKALSDLGQGKLSLKDETRQAIEGFVKPIGQGIRDTIKAVKTAGQTQEEIDRGTTVTTPSSGDQSVFDLEIEPVELEGIRPSLLEKMLKRATEPNLNILAEKVKDPSILAAVEKELERRA